MTTHRMTLLRILLILLIALGALGAGVWVDYQRFEKTPIALDRESIVFDIPVGSSLGQIAERLTERGAIPHPYYFIALAYRRGDQARIKAGEYTLTAAMTPVEVLDHLVRGKVVQYPITLVNGWTFRRAVEAIDAHPHFGGEGLAALSDAELMARLGHPGEHPEGRFFPDTYAFPRGTTGIDVLRRAMQRMKLVLAEEWAGRAENLPVETPYEALILASIVEKETAATHERAKIAGVFVRRLRMGMRLQTDPTVIYGMGERYEGDIRRSDLREATAYNTYVIDGLPPTPISLPGRGTIHAVLHPADGDALFFVSKGDGTHKFSATYAEHKRAVRRYILGK
ncbi:aminodeoxychorismate lyase [Marichromatium purpuratum 984]|uniref:Endolytic murein transglycosylase n=2 Tax=Marichromatium purpuratum TaxID=37487 RepID=W0DYT0_MARPU|nr:aminodeoxychorismate lyase [Marichromatium purpuratum 984]